MINLVTCSVYYSFKFEKKKNEQFPKNMNEILPKLIMRKIEETTQFLTYFGQDPVPPAWGQELEVAIKNYQIEEKIKDVYKGANQKLIKRMSDSFTIPKDFITFFTVAFAYHIIQTSKVISLQDYYNEEASKTVLDEIVEKYLRNVVCVEFGKKLGKANVSFQEPSPDECKGIIQIVDTFKSTTIESLINKMKNTGTEKMKKTAEKLAENIIALDVTEPMPLTDVFLLASGRNERQVAAIADEIELKLHEAGIKYLRREGKETGRWILLDFGDVICHVMHEEDRMYYSLERLYSDQPIVKLDVVTQQ